jgi:hypothetical protein
LERACGERGSGGDDAQSGSQYGAIHWGDLRDGLSAGHKVLRLTLVYSMPKIG